jgi:hypothetical protein
VKKLVALLAVAVVALSAVAIATAGSRTQVMLGAKLDAMQDNAKSKGTGTFTATVTGKKLSWKLTFTHLTGAATAAHIHLGKKGVAGNVIVPLCGPCKSGQSGNATITAAVLGSIKKGVTYVNVHTAKNPNGEIRGQVAAH